MLPGINAYVLFIELRMFLLRLTLGMLTGFIPAVGLDECDDVNSCEPVLVD